MTFTPRQVTLASWIIVFAGLLLALPLKLLPSLLAGLLVFELVNMLTPRLQPLIAGQRARWLAVALLGTLVGLFTIAIGIGPQTVPDVAYHLVLLAALAAGLVVAVRCRAG